MFNWRMVKGKNGTERHYLQHYDFCTLLCFLVIESDSVMMEVKVLVKCYAMPHSLLLCCTVLEQFSTILCCMMTNLSHSILYLSTIFILLGFICIL